MKSIIIVSLLIVTSALFAAETGKITGTVIDKNTGEALPGANVIVADTTIGAATDMKGIFAIINVPVGTYTIVFP